MRLYLIQDHLYDASLLLSELISNLLENKSDLNKKRVKKKIFFLDATQLDYRTVPMLSQTSACKFQCITKYLFP